MNTNQNKRLGTVCRCFALLMLALGLCSLAANAKPQAENPTTIGSATGGCHIISINTTSGVVRAKDDSTGKIFQFFVKDSELLKSLKEGQAISADFKTQQVFTSAGANAQGIRLGSILGDSYGPALGGTKAGPVDGAKPVQPVDSARSAGRPDGAGGGNVSGARPAGPVDGAKPFGPSDGTHAGNAANPAEPCCQLTNIDTSRGLITARDRQTGRAFQFRPANAGFLRSLNVGQPVLIDFATKQVSLMINGNRTIIGSIIDGGVTTQK